jgi:GAF domain-containing protein
MARRPKRAKRPAAKGRRAPEPVHRTKAEAASALANKLLAMLDQKSEQVALINGILRTVISGAELPDILRVFASNLKTLCPFDRCSISIYDEKARVFHVPYMVMGGRVQETHDAPRPYDSTVLSKVIETRQPLLRDNLAAEAAQFGADGKFREQGFLGEMLFPLTVSNRAFGTFNIGSFEANRLTERHVMLIQDVVPALAVAVWQHVTAKALGAR